MNKRNQHISIVVILIAVVGGIYLYLNSPQYEPQDNISVDTYEEKNENKDGVSEKWLYSDDKYGFTFEYPKVEQVIVEKDNLDAELLQLIKVKLNDEASYINVKIYDKENYASIGQWNPTVFLEEVRRFIASPEGYEDKPLSCSLDNTVDEIGEMPGVPCHIDIIKITVASLPAIQTSYASVGGYDCEIIFTNDKYIFEIGQGNSPCLDGNPEYYKSLPENVQKEWANFRQLLSSFKFN
ncbi:MAG: hypothetical protein COU71_02070 [Parcubacteria group bacterium CG10_big_fil_rev_8_21_14_0_10_38_31]|nr:MAG: hypothetical protein COU71_02070 [Parcubacteria group bacterium CG10_big_fil_rev_8_21_14_0_10_38_31]